jgi:hypothetical protein
MAAHNRKLREMTITIGGVSFQDQCSDAQIQNNTDDGEVFHTYGGDDASFVEPADDSYALALTLYADWRAAQVSDWLWDHDGETVAFTLVHHPNVVGETVQWDGEVLVKAPNVGGAIRTTEVTSVVLQCPSKPDKTRP